MHNPVAEGEALGMERKRKKTTTTTGMGNDKCSESVNSEEEEKGGRRREGGRKGVKSSESAPANSALFDWQKEWGNCSLFISPKSPHEKCIFF